MDFNSLDSNTLFIRKTQHHEVLFLIRPEWISEAKTDQNPFLESEALQWDNSLPFQSLHGMFWSQHEQTKLQPHHLTAVILQF